MPRQTRKTRTPMSGRAKVALTLVSLLSIAAVVVWRRSISVAENRVVRTLETRRRVLISLRTSLERDMNDAMSRARIVPAAERRLGMHVATELEVMNLPVPSMRDSIVADTASGDTTLFNRVASASAVRTSVRAGAR
jgi:hypothetical protein